MRKRAVSILVSVMMLLTMASVASFAQSINAPSASSANILLVQSSSYKSTTVKLKWNKIPKATKYIVYGNLCGKKYKKLSTVKNCHLTVNKISGKKLKAHKVYKFYVAAYKGTKKICNSKMVLCITASTMKKYGNVISISSDINELKLLKGDTYQLNISKTISLGKKHYLKGKAYATRYYSSDDTVASVDSKGIVTANKAGDVKIYAQDISGKYVVILVDVHETPHAGQDDPSRLGPLCFTADTNRSTVSMTEIGEGGAADLLYSTDGRNWKSFVADTTTVTLRHINDKMYIKAADTNDVVNGIFQMSGRISASGNVMSLLDSTYKSTTIKEGSAFNSLFSGCTSLRKAPYLPATTLSDMCYRGMFEGCTGLSTMPELPAEIMADGCYQSMFMNCGLIQGVTLPATTLADACYSYMFSGCDCVSFTGNSDSALSVKTLANRCYLYMFANCDEVINGPTILPATSLTDNCYKGMYMNCVKLTQTPSITVVNIGKSSCEDMFNGCTALVNADNVNIGVLVGIEMKASACKSMFKGCELLQSKSGLNILSTATSCCESMFEGCKKLKTAEFNLGITVSDNCYKAMFKSCASLSTAPDLMATELKPDCYSQMFCGCTNLKTLRVGFKGIEGKSLAYIRDWLKNASPTGTFYCPEDICEDYIPEGWTVKKI